MSKKKRDIKIKRERGRWEKKKTTRKRETGREREWKKGGWEINGAPIEEPMRVSNHVLFLFFSAFSLP